jgi:exodeoxyribonuclease III
MRLLTWNIRFGGIGPGRYEFDPVASPANVKAVAKSVISQYPDVIVLTEYRDAPETGGVIKAELESRGYQSHVSNPGLDKNGVLIAFGEGVRERFDVLHSEHFIVDKSQLDEIYYYRWLNLRLASVAGGEGFEVLGIHVPDVKRSGGEVNFKETLGYKKLFWEAVIRYAKDVMDRGENAVMMGDFNTGLNAVDKSSGAEDFFLSECMSELLALKDREGRGWVDAWRKFHRKPSYVDYTWYMPNGEGYRLDYAFLSQALGGKLKRVSCSDVERQRGLSDHSMLIVEINL